MRRRYGLVSGQYNGMLTYGGRIIVHHSREQLEWAVKGARVVEVPSDIPAVQTVPLLHHPDFVGAFDAHGDLRREAFRDAS